MPVRIVRMGMTPDARVERVCRFAAEPPYVLD